MAQVGTAFHIINTTNRAGVEAAGVGVGIAATAIATITVVAAGASGRDTPDTRQLIAESRTTLCSAITARCTLIVAAGVGAGITDARVTAVTAFTASTRDRNTGYTDILMTQTGAAVVTIGAVATFACAAGIGAGITVIRTTIGIIGTGNANGQTGHTNISVTEA